MSDYDERRSVTNDRGVGVVAAATSAFLSVVALGVWFAAASGSAAGILWVILLGFPFAFCIALLALGFVSLPFSLGLARLGWERRWVYLVGGGFVGVALATMIFDWNGGALPLLMGGLPGLVAGFIWWRGYRRHVQEIGDPHA